MSSDLVAKPMSLPVPVDSLEAYIRHVNSIPVLEADEERELATRLRDHQDLEAARKLIMAHLRFVVQVARKYAGYGLPLGDLIQEGNVGLMKAVRRFDPDREARLVSFAVHWIRAEIHEFVLRNWRIVKIATTKAQRKLFFNLRSSKKQLGWLKAGEADDLAENLGVDSDTVLEMETRMSGHDMAFDPAPGAGDDDEALLHAPSAWLADHRADPLEALERDDWHEQAMDALGEAMENLDPRSRDILQRRWLNAPKATLQELAAEYGVSAERIRQLEANAFKKLRAAVPDARPLEALRAA